MVAKLKFLSRVSTWWARLLWARFRHGRLVVVVRADKIGHLSLHTAAWIANYASACSELAYSPSTRVLVIPDSYVCNVYLWDVLGLAATRVGPIEFQKQPPASRNIGAGHEQRASESREALYWLLDRLPALGRFAVETERTIVGKVGCWVSQHAPVVVEVSDGPHDSSVLEEAGLVANQQTAVIIDRDGEYFSESASSPRDASVAEVAELTRVLLDNDYQVIRLGSSRRSMIPVSDPRFLDYPFSGIQTDRLDVELARAADIAIGWNTGLAQLPYIFDVPTCSLHVGADSPWPSMAHCYRSYVNREDGSMMPAWQYSIANGHIPFEELPPSVQSNVKVVPFGVDQWTEVLHAIEKWISTGGSEVSADSEKLMFCIKEAVSSSKLDGYPVPVSMWADLGNASGSVFISPDKEG